MHNRLRHLLEEIPDCISGFKVSSASPVLPVKNADVDYSFVKAIRCLCGNENLFLEAVQSKELRGVCSKSEVITYKAPIYVVCPDCASSKLLFDPEIHGWNAESGQQREVMGRCTIVKCVPRPGSVCVRYTYRDNTAYENLLGTGIVNIADYFDSFAVFYAGADANFIEIISCRCA